MFTFLTIFSGFEFDPINQKKEQLKLDKHIDNPIISPTWNNLSPFVEILKNLPRSIVGHKYGKNQNDIKQYSSFYNHTLIGYDLKKKEDYHTNIYKAHVKFMFVFNDSEDPISKNIIQFSEKNKINTICYWKRKIYKIN